MPTLASLLRRESVDTGNVGKYVTNLVGVLEAPDVVVIRGKEQVRATARWNGDYLPAAQAATSVSVPILTYSDMEAVEQAIGRALVLTASGQTTAVASWEHAPVLIRDLWRGRQQPREVLMHPATWQAIYLSTPPYVLSYMHPAVTYDDPAHYAGAKVTVNPHIPPDQTIWIADPENIGTLLVRSVGTLNHPNDLHFNQATPWRIGLMLNASNLAVICKAAPVPPRPTVWDRVLLDDLFT